MSMPSTVTLAEVQEAVEARTWIHITYDDGDHEWANLQERRSYYTSKLLGDRNFYTGMRDYVNGVWRYYHRNWGEQIHEEPFTPRAYPQTPSEYAVGDWVYRGVRSPARKTVETFADTLEGRDVVRFDTYDIGPAGLRALAHQVWADPESRLPVRIRKFEGRNNRAESRIGEFSFLETGPESIYELGAPEGLPTVTNWGVMEPEAQAIMQAAKEALSQLPHKMRVVKKNKYGVFVGYRMGDQFRGLTYESHNSDHSGRELCDYPDHLTDDEGWAAEHLTHVETLLFDRGYLYTFRAAEGLTETWKSLGASLRVRKLEADQIDSLHQLRQMWPYTNNVGPMTVSRTEPNTPPGSVLLRYQRADLRRDWFVDPQRDYICVKQREYRKKGDSDQWVASTGAGTDRADLKQLASGQWYAQTVYHRGRPEDPSEYEIELLTDSEFERQLELAEEDPAEFFDGERLIHEARESNIPITFWGR